MHKIELNKVFFAIVDDGDYETVKNFTWTAVRNKNIVYAVHVYRDGERFRKILMHRLILGLKDKNIQADHEDGDGLNNQRSNLRTCTNQQNSCNRQVAKNKIGGTKYLGVYYCKPTGKWMAKIRHNKKLLSLGHHATEKQAALVYNENAVIYHKEFARLNVIE